MTSLPRVAVPARLSHGTGDARISAANEIFHDVVALVRASGVEPVIVTDPATDLASFSGVVLPGGGDIDPARYGGSTIDALYDVNHAQDELDFTLAENALAHGIPILGICRGLQVLNAVYGGTLHEDLAVTDVIHSAHGADELTWAWHPVHLDPGSALAAATGRVATTIASGHHQGIRTLGADLRAVATASDGLIEAVEDPARNVIAVQWHPEAAGSDEDVRDAPFRVFAGAVHAQAGSEAVHV